MAAGNLIVSTDFYTDFNEYKNVIWISKNKDECVTNIEEALTGNYSKRIGIGINLAQEHSWDVIAQNQINIMMENLEN